MEYAQFLLHETAAHDDDALVFITASNDLSSIADTPGGIPDERERLREIAAHASEPTRRQPSWKGRRIPALRRW
ncbi:hypothetical protein [Streptomyces sp. NPDC002564]|uniref:hypothetical protein n=1 Tax=Streptomyces sp. NPDC002564 TaxID=3364649 RepID=UPI003699D702